MWELVPLEFGQCHSSLIQQSNTHNSITMLRVRLVSDEMFSVQRFIHPKLL